MKLACGDTYREAVASRPYTGIQRTDRETIRKILGEAAVVLEYKGLQNKHVKYYWKRYSQWWYYIIDQTTGQKVLRADGSGKTKLFHSIRLAMEWIYDNDSEYYNALPNLSTKNRNNKEKK